MYSIHIIEPKQVYAIFSNQLAKALLSRDTLIFLFKSSILVETLKKLYATGNVNNCTIKRITLLDILHCGSHSRLQLGFVSWLQAISSLLAFFSCLCYVEQNVTGLPISRRKSNELVCKELEVTSILLYIFQHCYSTTDLYILSTFLIIWGHELMIVITQSS
jgi:hypothetical protein